jgi:hypothetical protein
MRTRVALLVGAVLLGGLALAGTATATHADGQYHSLNDSIDTDENGTDVGVCMIGSDSPCNGEQWDGDNEIGDEQPRDTDRTSDDGAAEDDEVGICLVGADSACNGDDGAGEDAQITLQSSDQQRSSLFELLFGVFTVLF